MDEAQAADIANLFQFELQNLVSRAVQTRDLLRRKTQTLDQLDVSQRLGCRSGQCRRLGLARLLLAYRPLWLLDEPTVSLDAAGQRVLADTIDEHTAGGGLVVAATHLDLGVTRTKPLDLAVVHEAAA